jgi:hypothetical protein
VHLLVLVVFICWILPDRLHLQLADLQRLFVNRYSR